MREGTAYSYKQTKGQRPGGALSLSDCQKSLSLRASAHTGVAIRFQNAKFLHFSADSQLKGYGFPHQ